MDLNFQSDQAAADKLNELHEALRREIGRIIIGQDKVANLLLNAILCDGHCLLVGVPGLAKTLIIQTVAAVLDLKFSRIQFTPDLMPSDILGSETLNEARHFQFNKGPIFANIILADEINRTPPKTQSALLEAMQERSVTVANQTFQLEQPFFVLATQNPIEQEGTYPLPEAQLDRFMFNILVDYPTYKQELDIVKMTTVEQKTNLKPVMTRAEILYFQKLIRRVPVVDNVIEYAVTLVHKTRPDNRLVHPDTKQYLDWGAGPRASQALILAAKCQALLKGKYSPDIEDVQAVALPVLRHRLVKNFKAEAENVSMKDIVTALL